MNDVIETGRAPMCDGNNYWGPNANPDPPIDLQRVWFTTHALDQFHDRYSVRVSRGFTPFELLSWSEEDQTISLKSKKERLRRHRDTEARYFVFERWRFVIVERGDTLSVVTFEERHFPVNPKKRRWLRRGKGRGKRKNRRDAIW